MSYEETSNEEVANSKKYIGTTKQVIDSTLFRTLSKVIWAIIVPIGLFFLYHAWDALEEHSKELSGIAISLNDIKTEIKDIKDGYGMQIGQIERDEHSDQTDIAVLKSEVERPSPPLQYPSEEDTSPPPLPTHHSFRRAPNNPIVGLGQTIEKVFKLPEKTLSTHHPRQETGGR